MLWVPALVYMAGIFYVSSLSDPGSIPGGVSDKWIHAVEYAVLAVLLLLPLSGGRSERLTWPRAAIAAVLASAYGATDELHQAFVPGRVASAGDLAADAAGAALGAAAAGGAWSILRRSARSRRAS